MKVLITDLECDSLKPSTIHMVGVLNYFTDEYMSYHGDNVVDGLLEIESADLLIFYNGTGYDIPVIERLTNGLVKINRSKVIEVLNMSRRYVTMENHKLKQWGKLFGFPKGDHSDFSKYSPEMDIYCERDCRLTKMVFDILNEIAMEKGNKCLIESHRR
jgi:hypothetical protein